MQLDRKSEDDRAFRIALRIRENHLLLAAIYENLVDREFVSVHRDAKVIVADLRLIIKSIEDDDF